MTKSDQLLLYIAPDGRVMTNINKNTSVISILEAELAASSVCSKMEHTAENGKSTPPNTLLGQHKRQVANAVWRVTLNGFSI